MLTFVTMSSPIGTLRLYAAIDQLVGLCLPDRRAPDGVRRHTPVLDQATSELAEYFAGERHEFSLALAPPGTGFQRLVWDALLRIPYGETRSYGELARTIGRPAASRAVGAANGQNPIAIIVPCHRLIGANGDLTGYGGGLDAKRWLLDLERAGRERVGHERAGRERAGRERAGRERAGRRARRHRATSAEEC